MNDFKNEVDSMVRKILNLTTLFVKLISAIILVTLIPTLTIICIMNGLNYFNLSINKDLLRYIIAFFPGLIIGLIIKTKSITEKHSNNEEKNHAQINWRGRDWKWVIGILIAIIILLLTFWLGNNQNVGGYFSFGANSVSIALGLVAIFYSFNQSEAAARQSNILENTLQDINTKVLKLTFIKDDLLKMDNNITVKYDELINITKKAENVSKIDKTDEQKEYSKNMYLEELKTFREKLEEQKQRQLEDIERNLKRDYIEVNTRSKISNKSFEYEDIGDMSEYKIMFYVNEKFIPIDFMDNLIFKINDYPFKMHKYDIQPSFSESGNLLHIWLYGKGKNNIPLVKNYIYSCSNGIERTIKVEKVKSK